MGGWASWNGCLGGNGQRNGRKDGEGFISRTNRDEHMGTLQPSLNSEELCNVESDTSLPYCWSRGETEMEREDQIRNRRSRDIWHRIGQATCQ